VEFIDTELSEVKIIKGERFPDDRGFFSELYKEKLFSENGVPNFVQDNMSESRAGVVRGLHWQVEPFGQGKLVTCLTGSIIDVAVDVRPTSPQYGNHVAVKLDSREAISLWVPVGFAHGFQSLEEGTRVFYKVTNYWNKESERALNPIDPALGIPWSKKDFILSDKDAEAPNFDAIIH
jgi:dTDP-4-dehydrorhamnose 3,5-epimerase